MSNRVEELERQVAELQAAVNGLTEELVEMKERVRQVENATETDVRTEGTRPVGRSPTSQSATGSASASESASTANSPGTEAEAERDAESADSGSSDDVLVPEPEVTTPDAEATKSQQGKEREEAEDGASDESDIIVA